MQAVRFVVMAVLVFAAVKKGLEPRLQALSDRKEEGVRQQQERAAGEMLDSIFQPLTSEQGLKEVDQAASVSMTEEARAALQAGDI